MNIIVILSGLLISMSYLFVYERLLPATPDRLNKWDWTAYFFIFTFIVFFVALIWKGISLL